jgi:hypothetical protein
MLIIVFHYLVKSVIKHGVSGVSMSIPHVEKTPESDEGNAMR